jgi:DNA-3-methyladenine glycosylase II
MNAAEFQVAMRKAERALSRKDVVWKQHIKRVGPCLIVPRGEGRSHFEQLARAIVFQQLAGAAANTIWGRVRTAVGTPFTADAVMQQTDETLRAAGLSNNKLLSLRDLSAHVLDKRLRLASVAKLDDEEIIEELVRVRGIGRWTAEMFLMFQLGRLDVWPVGDLGVRNGYGRLYGLEEAPTVKELAAYGEVLKPYRSVAAWYCWRAADTVDPGVKTSSRQTSDGDDEKS